MKTGRASVRSLPKMLPNHVCAVTLTVGDCVVCPRCNDIYYSSPDLQKSHSEVHKPSCFPPAPAVEAAVARMSPDALAAALRDINKVITAPSAHEPRLSSLVNRCVRRRPRRAS